MNTLSLNNLHTEISSHLQNWNITFPVPHMIWGNEGKGFFIDSLLEFDFEIPLWIILIILVLHGILMCIGSSSDPIDLTGDSPQKKKIKLSQSLKEEIDEIIRKLKIQSRINDIRYYNLQGQIPYLNFPPGHPGHFTISNKYRLYSMVGSSEYVNSVYRLGLNGTVYYYTGIPNNLEVFASPRLIEIAEDAKKIGL